MPKWITQNKILLSILAVVVAAVIAMYVLDGDNINTFPGDRDPSPSPSTSATPKPDHTKSPKNTQGPKPDSSNPGPSSIPEPSSNPTNDPGDPTQHPNGTGHPGPTQHPSPSTNSPSPQQVVNQVCQMLEDGVGLLSIALLRGLRLDEVQRIINQECPNLSV